MVPNLWHIVRWQGEMRQQVNMGVQMLQPCIRTLFKSHQFPYHLQILMTGSPGKGNNMLDEPFDYIANYLSFGNEQDSVCPIAAINVKRKLCSVAVSSEVMHTRERQGY